VDERRIPRRARARPPRVYCDGCGRRFYRDREGAAPVYEVQPEHVGYGLGVMVGERYCAPCAREAGIR
jgi:hypothetical protein